MRIEKGFGPGKVKRGVEKMSTEYRNSNSKYQESRVTDVGKGHQGDTTKENDVRGEGSKGQKRKRKQPSEIIQKEM
jgi:hypothetical protein